MNNHSHIPYSNLTPEVILNAIESIGFKCTGIFFALNSFENRVYQIAVEEQGFIIAKFYRPNRWSDDAILEEHNFSKELQEFEIPVVAPLCLNNQTLHHYQEFRFSVFPRQSGHALELSNVDQLEWMGRFIGRLHAVSQCRKFHYRSQLTVENHGVNSFQFLTKNNFIPEYLISNYHRCIESLFAIIKKNFQEIKPSYIRLHGDCHAGNVLWSESGPQIVDLDDCIMGPAVQDLWMLLSGDKQQATAELHRVLQGYQEFNDFNFRELDLIESLRTLRLLHYAAWLAKRWEDPAFPLNFPFFNTPHYWQDLLLQLNEQERRLEPT